MAKSSGGIRKASIGGIDNAIEDYVSGEMMWLNSYLRGTSDVDSLSGSERRTLNLLTQATSKPLGKPTTLYRSVDASSIFGKMSDLSYEHLYNRLLYGRENGKGSYIEKINTDIDRLLSNATGKVITERGFMSTTRDKSVATEWGGFSGSSKPIVLKIKTSKKNKRT